jgi:hypothetical protein
MKTGLKLSTAPAVWIALQTTCFACGGSAMGSLGSVTTAQTPPPEMVTVTAAVGGAGVNTAVSAAIEASGLPASSD